MDIESKKHHSGSVANPQTIQIRDDFWSARQRVNSENAIFHQWEQLESTGRLDNFRKTAGLMQGPHQGFFYNDSDVHKWAEAAACILGDSDNSLLRDLLAQYTDLVIQAQAPDGYLFTYNQLNFPTQRWQNLQIESELYTLGHFIEAGIAANRNLGDQDLFRAVQKSADLITDVFDKASVLMTPGHQEIEIALFRLYQATGNTLYVEIAEKFLERRGRTRLFGYHLFRQFRSQVKRSRQVARRSTEQTGDPALGFDMRETLSGKEPPLIGLRANLQFLTGRYHQQHVPIRQMTEPVGHAVRWTYLQTAVAMLYRETGDLSLLATLEESWEQMVQKKMYVTGGIGSLPVVEGFGRSYELDNEFAYAETCAAIGSIFWNWQMTLATGDARYADLTEWQLYNAAAVGIALHGRAYLYRNPLQSAGGLTRKPWFGTACCPGNIARLWAQLGRYLVSADKTGLVLHQYIGCEADIPMEENADPVRLRISSGLPWEGKVTVSLSQNQPRAFCLKVRIPGWADSWQVMVDGDVLQSGKRGSVSSPSAGNHFFFESFYLELNRTWDRVTTIEILFGMPVVFHQSPAEVKTNRGKTALSRGPVVYCLEDIDNPQAGVPQAVINRQQVIRHRYIVNLLHGVVILEGKDTTGNSLVFIPYYGWANREPSKMQVWVSASP
ncbi:glycoside hydrolase family 127 protein [bacterium]|nr:glycoside hydrolase family 127 protein [bacterium]